MARAFYTFAGLSRPAEPREDILICRLGFLFVFAVASLAAVDLASAQSRSDGRLFYEMHITNAGTRSQGLIGTLYGADGAAIDIAPGETIETAAGVFRMHACAQAWDTCGMIREGGRPEDAMSLEALTDGVPWAFRLYILAEGSRSQGWRGELWHGDQMVSPASAEIVETALGRFVSEGESPYLWGWSGWAPASWNGE